MYRTLILAAWLSASAAGCSLSIATGDGSSGYTYTIHGRNGDSVGCAAEFVVLHDGVTVKMDEGVLTVDGKSYGEVAPGSTIDVDGARVVVNEVELQPLAQD